MTLASTRTAPSVAALVWFRVLASATVIAGCAPSEAIESSAPIQSRLPPRDRPVAGLSEAETATFNRGDFLFDLALHDGDGLGPLYTRNSCGSCHDGALRGPGGVQKMSVVLADGITPAPDQSELPFGHTVHPLVTAGATTPIVPPVDPDVKVTLRVGPPVAGRGFMEAVADGEIERMALEQAARSDGIHGQVNHVTYASQPNPDTTFHAHAPGDVLIGRFGLKARIATLDDFAADALQGDMGVTSPLRPSEFPNPDGLTDDLRPGVDVSADSVNDRADYTRMLDLPRAETAEDEAGRALFAATKCSVCHAPSLATRPDYPIAALAGIDAPVFTDFLLHDMGDALADGVAGVDGEASARQWRTAPLIGMGLVGTFLHDGRAKSLDEAILLHAGDGSEANESVALFQALSSADQAALRTFVGAL